MALQKRVLIVDDHPLFREGLKSLIDRSSGYRTIGEAGSAEDALPMAQELQPELVTMDISLPEKSGIEATREICQILPGVKILVVSMHPKFEVVADAFKAGAKGYVVKESTSEMLIHAMDTILRGEHYLDGNISQEVVAKLMAGPEEATAGGDQKYDTLSPREQQVMRLVAEGGSSKDIAAQLSLSPKTVENHRGNMMKKLGVHNKIELVRYAARLGLIDLDNWKE